MKKLALVTAIAATISAGAHAIVGSDITAITLVTPVPGGANIAVNCNGVWNPGFFTGLGLTGPNAGAVTLSGNICLDPNSNGSPYVALNFGLTGAGNAGGTTFDGGGIAIWT